MVEGRDANGFLKVSFGGSGKLVGKVGRGEGRGNAGRGSSQVIKATLGQEGLS